MATPETDLRFSAAGVENPNRCYIGACRRQSLHGSNSVISTMNIPPSRDLKTNKTLQMSKRCNRNCASIADKAATSSNSLSISCVFHIFSYLNSFKKKHAAFRCDFILSFLSLKGIKKNYFPFFFVYFLILQSSFLLSCAAPDPTEPIIRSDATNHKNFSVFTGSNGLPASATSLGLQFQILTFLEEWEDTRNILLIGGLDYIYMLDPTAKAINKSLPYMERLQWTADQYYVGSCLQFRPEEECNNFIKIVQKFNNDTLFVCGTNAYTPRCRYYTRNDFRSPNNRNSLYYYEDSCKRSCDVPYTPEATSVLLYTNTTQGYRRIHAVNGQFHGRDSKLLKTGAFPVIFSEENWFNEPVFIKIIEYQNKAYLFFREMAAGVEAGSSTTTYGRVAQVCLNDTGGERLLRDEWTSFLKARLKCSLPSSNTGQEELTFNNLTSVSDIVNITMGDQKIEAVFATFTTPQSWNPVSLSAVCVFTMKSIQHLFETGELLDERRLHSSTESFMSGTVETYIKVPVQEQAIPRPRPGTCMKPGEMRQASVLYFIRNHFIMYGPILAFQKSPLFVSDLNIKMTQVAVDSKAGNSDRLIVYVGTDDGRILRLRPKFDGNSPSKTRGKQSIFLEEMRVMKKSDCETKSCAVRALHVYRPTEDNERPYLFVAFNQKLVRTPLSICDRYKKDICCNFDPECGWKSGKCVERINGNCSLPEIADSGELPDSCYNEIGDQETTIPAQLLQLFTDHILPEIISNYNETAASLETMKQKVDLDRQLQETVVRTSELVLRNHREEHCLKSQSISSLVHVYPLLLHEVTEWHLRALNKFKAEKFKARCWDPDRSMPCFERISFIVPFPLTLWEPMTNLLREFDAECNIPDQSFPQTSNFNISDRCPPITWNDLEPRCRDANHCFPRKCVFVNYTVDVMSFFRHVNETQKFLGSHEKILSKVVDRAKSQQEIVRGHLALNVSQGRPFRVIFDPVKETVKITFHIEAVRNCSLCQKSSKRKCGKTLSVMLHSWYNSTRRRLKVKRKRQKKCDKETNKANLGNWRSEARTSHNHHYVSDYTNNNLPSIPDRCIYIKVKGLKPTDQLWSQAIKAAINSGGFYSGQRIMFRSLEDVMSFFRSDQCPSIHVPTLSNCVNIATGKRPGLYVVQVIVSESTPFVIERNPRLQNVRLKFFVQITKASSTECVS